ncbi:MAG: Fic family protein, partial [Actinobacteria bacterium]|nr:Fic family protein [Actinomycetota bacterium]
MYIYERPNWPKFKWNIDDILKLLIEVKSLQGRVVGQMGALGFRLKDQANLAILTQEILRSSEIEGQLLNTEQVRSSIARRLGLDISGLVPSDRNTDGVVEMSIDATVNFNKPLNKQRLFVWHNSLFPAGYSGTDKILVGKLRDDLRGPMQVVSGPMGKEKIHYEAPASACLEKEMSKFIEWFNNDQEFDLVIKAALAHLWFVTLHPFEDGNGRIARVITDMFLARSDCQSYRFYSMSAQIRNERKQYYDILEFIQKGDLDITKWLQWFLKCLLNALKSSDVILKKVLFKHKFWTDNSSMIENERQRKILNKLLDGFEGKLTSSKWAKITKCSQDTALRD